MHRLNQLQEFVTNEYKNVALVESPDRIESINTMIKEIITAYNPSVIVKMGLGNGEIAQFILNEMDGVLVVIDPSIESLKDFNSKSDSSKNTLYCVAGTLDANPIDYYVSNLTISIDNLNFIDSALAIDEMRRNIDFESILMVATPVLSDKDEDAFFDIVLKEMEPLHNEYYMKNEINTVLKLNEFKIINEKQINTVINVKDIDITAALKENEADFKEIYEYKEDSITIPYHQGYYMRLKPLKEIDKDKV